MAEKNENISKIFVPEIETLSDFRQKGEYSGRRGRGVGWRMIADIVTLGLIERTVACPYGPWHGEKRVLVCVYVYVYVCVYV